MRFKIVEKIKGGYKGMHKKAYEEKFREKYPYPEDVILLVRVNRGKNTRKHETDEKVMMDCGLTYHPAHDISLITEVNKNLRVFCPRKGVIQIREV